MFGQYLLTFREVLEAGLITAIIIAFLIRTDRQYLVKPALKGVAAAVLLSIVLGAGLWILYGELPKSSQTLFEGVSALVAVFVLTSMIIWMAKKSSKLKGELEERVKKALISGAVASIAIITFIVVFREGLETVLFLIPYLVTDPTATLAGTLLGIGIGTFVSFIVFRLGFRFNLRRFFYFTSILLVLLAGGLLGYGLHELAEYAELNHIELGVLAAPAYDLGIAKDNVFHHKGAVGSIFAVLFGYTVKAEWIRLIAHLAYLAIFLPAIIWIYTKSARPNGRLKRKKN